ncbi:MAG TPA: NAD-dependent epimerase [Verrucomicrobiae bacterium]|nr:NAD-dependent epimerase [Verrucomicrobiae bacterium]
MKILVTGAAGFIGMHVAQQLLDAGHSVVGVDNLSSYYDVGLKRDRLEILQRYSNFRFGLLDLAETSKVNELFAALKFERVIHLAAQAGVRYSLQNPHAYIQSNIVAFTNILEACRHMPVNHLVYASSSSVYGSNTKLPFSVQDNVDHPVSLYAATKKSNELMAHAYSHLYALPATGLRFFTVYGPWGRPDMAVYSFTRAILEGKPIDVFNHGKMQRDFTYIDDIVTGILQVADRPPLSASGKDGSRAPHRIYNIGNHKPVELMKLIEILEECLGGKAIKNMLPLQAGDVHATFADVDDLMRDTGFRPSTPIEEGIASFVQWYRSYYTAEKKSMVAPLEKNQSHSAA